MISLQHMIVLFWGIDFI